ncbi:MAG: glycosyltransferase family 25 protein [Thermoguttaceae bacterium]
MQVFYINLQSRKDRNEEFLRRNSRSADCCRVNAPEGKRLRIDELLTAGLIAEPLEAYSLGILACTLSHKELWERAVSTAAPVTIAEDDAVLNRCFSQRAEKVIAKLPVDWDIILWGWNFDSMLHCEVIPGLKGGVMYFDPSPLREKQDQFQEIDVEPLPLRLFGAFGILCYSVSPKGAGLLQGLCFPLRNELVAIPGLGREVENFSPDVIMNKYYRVLKAYVSFPPLAWSENDKTTSSLFPPAERNPSRDR